MVGVEGSDPGREGTPHDRLTVTAVSGAFTSHSAKIWNGTAAGNLSIVSAREPMHAEQIKYSVLANLPKKTDKEFTMKRLIAALALSSGLATVAAAAPFNDSTFGGDASDLFEPFGAGYTSASSVGVLGLGTHTFSGQVSCPVKESFDVDAVFFFCVPESDLADLWAFDLAAGFTLTSVMAEVTDFNGALRNFADFQIYDTGLESLGFSSLDALGATDERLLSPIAGPGYHYMVQTFLFSARDVSTPVSISYQWSLTVAGPSDLPATVPLPATAFLLFGGLGGVAMIRRRRR